MAKTIKLARFREGRLLSVTFRPSGMTVIFR